MSKRLATPYLRGKSDVIENAAPYNGSAVAEGLAVCRHSDGTIKAVSSASDVIVGVAAMKEHKYQSFIRTGLEVYVPLAEGANPSKGAAVYVQASTGKFTEAAQTGTGGDAVNNIAVNATFSSGKETVVNSAGTTCDGAAIDFPGGL